MTDAGVGVEPVELALHLQRQFARRRDDEAERQAGRAEALLAGEQRRGDGQAEGHGLARAGLRRDQQVGALVAGLEHGELHGGQRVVAARGQSGGKRLVNGERRRGRREVINCHASSSRGEIGATVESSDVSGISASGKQRVRQFICGLQRLKDFCGWRG